MDPWERQRALARTTTVWAAASIVAGGVLATRSDRWWRAFGQQHLGWGAVDLAIVVVATRWQDRRMGRLADPFAPAALEHERRQLRKVLLVNVVADAAYVVVGVVLWRSPLSTVWRSQSHPRAAGAGAAIVVQGAFLLLHDARHAWGSGPALSA